MRTRNGLHYDANPFPDAWCDDCELVGSARGGWDEEYASIEGPAGVRILNWKRPIIPCQGNITRASTRDG